MNKRYWVLFQTAFAVLGILFYSASINITLISEVIGISESILGTFYSLIRYFLWFGSTLFLCLRWSITWSIIKRSKLVWIIFGLSMISFTWSHDPGSTIESIRELLQMTSFGLYFASRFKLRDQLCLIAFTLGFMGLVSALLAVGMPSLGTDQEKFIGAWTGVYNGKNDLGKRASLSILLFSLLITDKQLNAKPVLYLLTWGGLCLASTLAIFSTSQSSLSVSIISILFLVVYRLYQRQGNKRRLYLEVFTLLFIIIVAGIASSWETILASMGRDITLTGRTEIWGTALSELYNRSPLLGFGRGTFWAPGSSLARIAGAAVGRQYIPPHAHNGYIDLALEIGYFGLFCFLASFIATCKHAITRSFVSKTPKDLWPLAFLIWLAIYNFSESMLMNKENLYWPLYVAVALCARPGGRAVKLCKRKLASCD